MKFVKLNGWVEDSSFISLGIENGKNSNSIGDQVWISKDGTEMEVYESADTEILQEAMNFFESNSKRAFKGALLRMGVNF